MTENKVSSTVYYIEESSTIQLNRVTFICNNLENLLWIHINSSSIIQNDTLTGNDISLAVYYIRESSTIQLNHVTFIRNKIIQLLGIY